MHDISTYQIRVQGRLDEGDINAKSPLQIAVAQSDAATTLLTVCTDQSGLIGLMRHLHGRGVVFLSMKRAARTQEGE